MNTANKSDNEFSSVEKKLIKELVSDGREKGFVTIDEINESLGDETPSPEQLEKIFNNTVHSRFIWDCGFYLVNVLSFFRI